MFGATAFTNTGGASTYVTLALVLRTGIVFTLHEYSLTFDRTSVLNCVNNPISCVRG